MHLKKIDIKGVNNPKDKKTCGILIQSKSGEDMWVNGWQSHRTQQLNKGESIYVFLYQEEYKGKNYWKFKLPSIDHLLAMKESSVTKKEAEELTKDFGGKATDDILNEINF